MKKKKKKGKRWGIRNWIRVIFSYTHKKEKKIKNWYSREKLLIKIGRFGWATLYIIKEIIPEADSDVHRIHSATPLMPYMPEIYLGIMLAIIPVYNASFLIDKADTRRHLIGAMGLRYLDI